VLQQPQRFRPGWFGQDPFDHYTRTSTMFPRHGNQRSRLRSSRIRGVLSSIGGNETTKRSYRSLDSRIFANFSRSLKSDCKI
jgi:hypothetical protein